MFCLKSTILYNGSHNITQPSPVTLFFRFLIDQRCGRRKEKRGRGRGIKRRCRDCCHGKTHRLFEATSPIRREQCMEKGEKPALGGALFGGFELGLGQQQPQPYSTVSIATQPAAAAAKVEGTWKGLKRPESQPYFGWTTGRKWSREKREGGRGGVREEGRRGEQEEGREGGRKGRERENAFKWMRGRRECEKEGRQRLRETPPRPMNAGIVPLWIWFTIS